MLITHLKAEDELRACVFGKVLVISCEGCKEVYFPEVEMLDKIGDGWVKIRTDSICNLENQQLKKHADRVKSADTILVLACGAGVQTVASFFDDKRVVAACDTYPLHGWQGVTPLEYSCGQCGECFLNDTGGICPITSCSKGLINGQCGGVKDGNCEVDKDMVCGWERIYKQLERLGQLDTLTRSVKIRDFARELESGNENN